MTEHLGPIDRREALRYLRIRGGETPPDLERAFEDCERDLRDLARPRTVWRLFDLDPDGRLVGTSFLPEGECIRRHLFGCTQLVLMAATLGSEVDALLRRAQTQDVSNALLLDALANAAIESVCDELCAQIAARLSPRLITSRFSPGYGDLPLRQQADLFEVLDVRRRIGVSLTESGLMIPQKTVTALIGVKEEGDDQP